LERSKVEHLEGLIMKTLLDRRGFMMALGSAVGASALAGVALAQGSGNAKPASTPLSGDMLIQPEELHKMLDSSSGEKPLVFQVGFHILYTQAHIPGAEYLGPASKPEGIALLRKRAASLSRKTSIVLYCGCCPWVHCPNIKPAYETLKSMGFTNLKVMYVADNFGTDWVNKGYPVAKGES
jgi:thiosulfate/3-mercaptopyruvate sulfurtransferase